MHDVKGIVIQAIFSKASTLVDGSWRISFDVNDDQAQEIMQISSLKDQYLTITVLTEHQLR